MSNDQTIRGIRQINNAKYLKDIIVPFLLNDNKITLAIFNLHMATEFLLGGLCNVLNIDPKPISNKHNLKNIVSKLKEATKKDDLPYFSYDSFGAKDLVSGYTTSIRHNQIDLWESVGGTFTSIGASAEINRETLESPYRLQCIVESETGKVLLNDVTVMEFVPHFEGDFYSVIHTVLPSSQRIKNLFKLTELLTHDLLLESRYALRVFTKEEFEQLNEQVSLLFNMCDKFYSL